MRFPIILDLNEPNQVEPVEIEMWTTTLDKFQ